MYVVLLFLFSTAYLHASATQEYSDTSTSETSCSQLTPRTDQCIPMPCGVLTPRGSRLTRHTSVSSLLSDSSQSDSPRTTPISTPRNRNLVRCASVSSLIELSSSRSQSGDSPRLGLSTIQTSSTTSSQISLSQALPSPTTAYITDMQITRLIQDLNRTHFNTDTILTSILRNISVSTTHDPILVNEGYKIFTTVITEEATTPQREQVYQLYTGSLYQPAATRLLAWKEYQTAVMIAMNKRLQDRLPGIITKESNTLHVAYNDPMPTSFTPEQISYLHQHILAYTYMLNEQERTDGELFTTLFADQITNYRRYMFSLEQQQSAQHLIQSLIKPKAIGITDMQIANIIHEHACNGTNILTEFLRSINVATLQTSEQVHDAHTQFMSIITQQNIADSRQLALNRSQSQIAMRSECWQGYHLAIMMHLNALLTDLIPGITTDHTKLYLAFMARTQATLTTEQAKHLIKYILTYAVMLSEQEGSDPEAFEHTFKQELALLRQAQSHSPKLDRRKRSGSSIASFSSFRGLFKKGDGPSSSMNN